MASAGYGSADHHLLITTLQTNLGGHGSSLSGYSPVIQEILVVGVSFNQSWPQVEHGRK